MDRQLLVLDEINEQGKVMFPMIHNALTHEFSQDEFGKIINELKKRELIEFDKQGLYVEITERGVNKLISLKQQKAELKRSQQQINLKEQFEIENLRLNNENLQYSKFLREKDKDISELTIKNLKLQNRQLKWNIVFIVIGFIVGFVTSNLDWVIELFKK